MGDAFIAPDAEETYYRQKESTAEGSNFKQLPVADFHYKESSTPWWVAILIIFPPAMIPFAKYHVELKDGELSFGYLLGFSRRVNVKDIQSVELENLNWQDWGGWGIKYSNVFGGTPAYLARDGSGLRIALRDKSGRSSSQVLFSVLDAPGLKAKIEALISHK